VSGLLEGNSSANTLLRTETLFAPHLIDLEVAHALRSRVQRGVLPAEDGAEALRTWGNVGMTHMPVRGLLLRIWELRHNLSSYDASYVTLAESYACPFATSDVRIASAAGPRCRIIVVPR
jgi:predicted nucleic acid-binding protein